MENRKKNQGSLSIDNIGTNKLIPNNGSFKNEVIHNRKSPQKSWGTKKEKVLKNLVNEQK